MEILKLGGAIWVVNQCRDISIYILAKVTSGVTLANLAPLIFSFLLNKAGTIMISHRAVVKIK